MDDSDEDQRTVWCGNISDKVTEELLYELFLQAAPLQRVRIPKDKDGKQTSYGFVTFKHLVSVQYATELLNGTALYDKIINIKPRNGNLQRQNSYHRDDSPVHILQSPQMHPLNNMLGALPDLGMLMRMGDQLLLNNKVHTNDMNNSYNNDRNSTPYRRWEQSNYRDDRREDNRPYRRHNNHRSSDRHNSYNHTPYRGNRRFERR